MQIKLIQAGKWDLNQHQAILLICDEGALLGKIKGNKSLENDIQDIISQFKDKKNTAGFEVIRCSNTHFFVTPLPSSKGLDQSEKIRVAAYHGIKAIRQRQIKKTICPLDNSEEALFRAAVEGMQLENYSFTQYKTGKDSKKPGTAVTIEVSSDALGACRKILGETIVLDQAVSLCRNLVNEPAGNLTPADFVAEAESAAKKFDLSISVMNDEKLRKEGFTGLITVGNGSPNLPYMVTLTYDGCSKSTDKKRPHLVLVGKGITFDTGGISLKPSSRMWEMKTDMAGAASVLAAISAIAAQKLKIKVSAVLALAENRPGENATLPGDIFKAKNGKTVMVENTDAEGRLVLSDALAQAGLIGATHIVDVATLTGSIVNALGSSMSGIFSNDQGFAHTIIGLGRETGEKLWEMPLEEEYRSYLDDYVADMKNVGKSEAGAITAALFLKEFVPDKTIWAHIDIAGTALLTKSWKYFSPGATGFSVKTLAALAKSMQQSE